MFQEIITYLIITSAILWAGIKILNAFSAKKDKCGNCSSSIDCELKNVNKMQRKVKI